MTNGAKESRVPPRNANVLFPSLSLEHGAFKGVFRGFKGVKKSPNYNFSQVSVSERAP